MNLVIFADGKVGQQICEFLLIHFPGDVTAVVTVADNEIARQARKHGKQVEVFTSEPDLLSKLPNDLDLGLLAWWPKIISRNLLKFTHQGFINTHPSLLPHNRGKNYNFWALVEQAPFGVTLHQVTEGIDGGDIVAQSRIEYDWTDTGETLYMRAQEEMVKLFATEWPKIRLGQIEPKRQNIREGSYHAAAELHGASCIQLEQNYRAADLLNLLRARTFGGHPSCWFVSEGERFQVTVEIKRVNT